jgi:hypothetical protein
MNILRRLIDAMAFANDGNQYEFSRRLERVSVSCETSEPRPSVTVPLKDARLAGLVAYAPVLQQS